MFARRTGIGLAVIAVVACAVVAFGVLRDGTAPRALRAAARRPRRQRRRRPWAAGSRSAVPGTAGQGLVMVATQVKIDPRTGIVISCRPVLGNGPLTYDLRYAPRRARRAR